MSLDRFLKAVLTFGALGLLPCGAAAGEPLAVSVYATAGDVLRYAADEESCGKVAAALAPLKVTRLFLEGRRGDEYVPPSVLRRARTFFEARGVRCSGGIATVPGANFGVRQDGPLGWLNWESPKTQADIKGFFSENAGLFPELIVDDFFCTADTTSESLRRRGERSWGDYRRDLLVGLIAPSMRQPTLSAQPPPKLIIKFPQWYDRFHLFGYDPVRMAEAFEQVWVGTEVRDPKTRRMGYVQPTEGYVNFSWLRSALGTKVRGAWFDHIECSAQNFVDQAFQSVLAGAKEVTLFHLGDVMEKHRGDELLAQRWPELFELAGRVQAHERRGIPFYKPPNSDANDNLYLMDYLCMMGLPILPRATYPGGAPVLFLGVQAAHDLELFSKLRAEVDRGATAVLTPALVLKLGGRVAEWLGIKMGGTLAPALGTEVAIDSQWIPLESPLQIDGGLVAGDAEVLASVRVDDRPAPTPLLTSRRHGAGRVLLLNVRTFSDADFGVANEWLLAPEPRGWSQLPARVGNALRQAIVGRSGHSLEAPSGIVLYSFEGAACLYSFRDEPSSVRLDGRDLKMEAHECRWVEGSERPFGR